MRQFIASIILLTAAAAARAAQPCCSIKAIDIQTGVITAVENRSGTTFRFQASAGQIRDLKLGDAVDADFRTGAVTVPRLGHHFSILPSPVQPCCAIVSVDAARGRATARVTATGATFQIVFDGWQRPAAIVAGQDFDANFQIGIAAIGSSNFRLVSAAAGAKVFPVQPCCSIRAIDGHTLTVADASGRTLQVLVTNPAALGNIKVGSRLFANNTMGVFSADGSGPCCSVPVR